jgi:uncharacterized protein (DUF1800 family)
MALKYCGGGTTLGRILTMLNNATALHLSNRLGFGPAPGVLDRIRQAGFDAFLETQLNPQLTDLPEPLSAELNGLPSFGKGADTLYAEYWWKAQIPKDERKSKAIAGPLKAKMRQVGRQARIARLARAVASPHQLHEALVEFWFNHFNVYENKGPIKVWIGAYEEEAIRPYTLGRFSDLLLATAKHPAMLVYLDNSRNVAPASSAGRANGPKRKDTGINENYAREVMELHTLGVDGGYTQADVTSLAHVLTGWTVGAGAEADVASAMSNMQSGKGVFRFAQRRHDAAAEVVLGKTFSGDGVSEGEAALLMLAHHPATARHISFKLAQYFVADEPPAPLVTAMADTFRKSDGDIRAVLKVMFTSKEFLASSNFGVKFKTPYRFVVSAARAASVSPANVGPLFGALKELGQPLYGCISPDGYACTQSAWLDPDSLLRRLSFAASMGSGNYGAGAGDQDSDRMLETLGSGFGETTLAAIAQTDKSHRVGAVLGSPEFMRC